MTPKNRDELADHIDKWLDDDLSTGQLFKALDAAGLAIVPKEPTKEMWQAQRYMEIDFRSDFEDQYRAMLEASPFRETS